MTMFKGERRMPVFRDSEPEDSRIETFARAALYERLAEAMRAVERALATEHTHIFQVKAGVPGCPVCERIDPIHMTREYVWNIKQREQADRARDYMERALRE
jgi:hypothetical protein